MSDPIYPAVPDELREQIHQMFTSAWQDGVNHLNPKYLRRDTLFTDKTLALFTQYAREERIAVLEKVTNAKMGRQKHKSLWDIVENEHAELKAKGEA